MLQIAMKQLWGGVAPGIGV